MRWRRWSRRAEEWREEAREHVGESTNLRIIAIALVIYFVGVIALGMYWSREPALFQVSASAGSMLHQKIAHPAVGGITTAALLQTVTTLLDKPGGFINNDIAPPGLWLDNISSWERGALSQARDMTVVLRDVFGHSDASADEDDDLARAAPRLNFSNDSWMLPSSESQYRDAIDYLRAYLTRLQQGDDSAHFVATADNLDRYLAQIARRLDALSQQLSACVKPHENPLLKSSERNLPERATTPAYQIDNIFYEARGSAWALLHLLRAIEIDFADVLRAKNAQTALHQIIADLEATQEPIYSPVILNGSGFGLLANHSLVMASYIARANAAAVNTRALLTQSAPSNSTPPVQD